MPFKLTVTAAGAQHEVEVDAATLPESAVSEVAKAHKLVKSDTFTAELDRRVEGVIKNKGLRVPAELLEDATHVAAVLEKHGKVDAAQAATQLTQRVETERRGWEEKVLKPVADENKSLKDTNSRLVTGMLHGAILAAAGPSIKKDYLTPVGASKVPYIVAAMEPAFGFDPQSGRHFVKTADGQGFEFSADQKKYGTPFMGVAEYVERFVTDPANARFVENTSQGGPGMGGAGGAGDRSTAGGIIWLTPEEAGDAETRRRAYEQAKKTGATVRTRMPAGFDLQH